MRSLLALFCVACALPRAADSESGLHSLSSGAWIGPDSALFVFPAEPRLALEWDVPDSLAYRGRPEYAWEVYWEPRWDARGKVPHALWLITYWDSGGPHRGRLVQMLRRWPAWKMTECMECDGASLAEEDSALSAALVGDRLEFTVRGASGMARIFPTVPDTVRLIRRLGAEAEDEEITVPVRQWGGD